VSNIHTLFLNYSDVGKTFSQLQFGASWSARDVLRSRMLEISILYVISETLQLFLANIYVTHVTFICVKFFWKSFTRYFL